MIRFLLQRIVSGIITIWFIATATFLAMHLVPGDPLSDDKATTPEIRAHLQARYGLDQPMPVQYLRFLGNMLQGDFGISFTQKNRRVNDIIREHFPVSAVLGLFAIAIAIAGGILWGAITAACQGRLPDRVVMVTVVLCISVPGFVIAALAQLGIIALNNSAGTILIPVAGWGSWQQMLVPATVLGLGTMAYITRLMRATLLEQQHADYLRTARAKGLAPVRLFFHHQLRNALLPVLTVLGPAIATITTGGFVVETVFAIPGLGRYFIQAVQQLDYTVIMGTTVFYGSFLVAMVLLVDIVYGLVDPRIRQAGR